MTEDQASEQLEARLAEIVEENRISEESRGPVTLQQDSVGRLSRMDAMQQQQMALAAEQRRHAEAARIKAALARIDEGDWGYCLSCGDDIAVARLEHDPSVSQCIGCAGKND